MKLTVLQENLSKALVNASRFTSSKAQLPVLSNVLLSTQKNKLLISSTNLEISINLSIGAKISKEGEITVPARTLTDIISNLPSGTIELEAKKEQLLISTNNFSSKVLGMNSADFPSVPNKIGSNSISIPTQDLINSLSQVLFSTSIDESRPVLTGVLFVFERGKITFVSTDGFRLTEKIVSVKKVKAKEKIIIPKTVLGELVRIASDTEEISFSYSKSNSQVVFGMPGVILSSRVLAGEFPNYKKRIPDQTDLNINLDKEDLIRAVKLSGVFARDSANIIKLIIEKESIKLSAESARSGSQENSVDAKVRGLKKGGFEIAFNYRFIEEFLQVIQGEDVSIGFIDPGSPGIFRDSKDTNFLYLVMPVKV